MLIAESQISTELNLEIYSYYPYLKKLIVHLELNDSVTSYYEIKHITHCSSNAAKSLWPCIAIIKEALADHWALISDS